MNYPKDFFIMHKNICIFFVLGGGGGWGRGWIKASKSVNDREPMIFIKLTTGNNLDLFLNKRQPNPYMSCSFHSQNPIFDFC